jgi:phosphoribosyl 1,2-cyclic phosphate phosphodiesterase
MLTVTVLGCGSSGGVPLIGCTCAVCTSDNPKNNRTRVSLLVRSATTTILIDTSPDMRVQCLRENLSKVDAIIYTHAHADHMHGIDDIRSFNHAKNGPIDVYADEATLAHITSRFAYTTLPPKPAIGPMEWGWYRPCLNCIRVTPLVPFSIGDIDVMPIEQQHGLGKTLGLRFGVFGYSTDVNGFSEESMQALDGIDTWIVDCLRREPSPTHADLAMSLGWIKRIKPRHAYLTHLNHSFDYDALARELPEGVFPAYDGMQLIFP